MNVWSHWQKRTPTKMKRIDSPDDLADLPRLLDLGKSFRCPTREGWTEAPYGSWVAIDAGGLPYPIAPDIQAQTYVPYLPIVTASHLPEKGEKAVFSPCCNYPLQAQAIGCAAHPDLGKGVSVVVSCARCDTPYGRITHVFGDGDKAAATVIPND